MSVLYDVRADVSQLLHDLIVQGPGRAHRTRQGHGATKLDLTGVANEKMKFVHVGEKLIIVFDNQSTVTVHPFFDSMGVPLQNITVEVSAGRDLASGEFASTFPITTDGAATRVIKVVKPGDEHAIT